MLYTVGIERKREGKWGGRSLQGLVTCLPVGEPSGRCLHCFRCALIGRLLKPNLPRGWVLRSVGVAAPVAKPYPAKQAVRGRGERWGGSTGAKGTTLTGRYVDATLLSCLVLGEAGLLGRFYCHVGTGTILFFPAKIRGWASATKQRMTVFFAYL